MAKCSWYVMYWEWEKGCPRLREITPTDPTIRLQQGSNVSATTEIRRTRLDESTRMLGVYLNPLGDFGYHIDVLKKKADGYASRLISSRLTANDIRIFHRSIYVPAMRYSLATIAADEEALAGVQHRIIKATTLADLTHHENSSKISLSPALDGQRSDAWVHNPLWPRQEAPTPTQRRLWKWYLRYVPYWKSPPKPPDLLSVQGSAPLSTSSFESIHDYVRTLPTTQRRLLADLHQEVSDVQVWRAFRSKARLYIASDGGLDGNRGTHGWVIASKKHTLFRCSGPVDGFVSTESSTRSELAGCASSSLLLVAIISRIWGLRHRCSFRWITDSRSAISRVKRYALPNCHQSKMPNDADLISLISTLIIEIRRPLRLEWVKGHQDSLQSYEKLPLKASLNIDADFLATRYRN
ncbi:hypothetical protein MHU86_11954 [Fragilaria crotonensis]|nr:hypothetical protein MHU86_11954 [Fragilaria crotonensis]